MDSSTSGQSKSKEGKNVLKVTVFLVIIITLGTIPKKIENKMK